MLSRCLWYAGMNAIKWKRTPYYNVGVSSCTLLSLVLCHHTVASDGRFQREINHDNVLGSGGKLAVEFATLLKILWSGKRHSYAPSTLKVRILVRSRYAWRIFVLQNVH